MADTTLAQLESRMAVQLADASHRIYPTASLEEAIRQALDEYSARGGEAVTILNLDSALTTTLPKLHEGLILLGACAFAIATRSVDRADSFTDGKLPKDLAAYSKDQVSLFRQLLEELLADAREKDLKGAAVPPWSTVSAPCTGGPTTESWDIPDD